MDILSLIRWRRAKWPEVSIDEIRKRARIVVIDDAEFYYLTLFQKDGYIIEKWDDVTDLQKLEAGFYDIILLDIQGVGKSQSTDQGLGIIKHLKRVRPSQIIVAYSNADWPLKYKEFFDLADATLDKRGDYVDFKRKVDDLLSARFSLGFYVDRITGLVGPGIADVEKLRATIEKAVLHRDPKILQRLLSDSKVDWETIKAALEVAQTAIAIISMFTK